MDNTQTITTYESILTATNEMLAAAQNNEWDKLIDLERKCRELTDNLVINSSGYKLSDDLQQKKIKIIHEVLANDAQIRTITEPWMMQLQNLLNTARCERNLQQTYQSISKV